MLQHQIIHVQEYSSQLMFIIEKFFILFLHSSKMQHYFFKVFVFFFQLSSTQNQKIFNILNLALIHYMSDKIFYFNKQYNVLFIKQFKKKQCRSNFA